MKQFKSNSHHIQGTNLSGKHCYACHWEATPEGLINAQYHVDISAKASAKTKKREVHLVVWDQGKRPTVYKSASTAITYNIMSIGTQSERKDIAKLTTHCLGCHSDSANAVRPFSGDAGVPLKYAWDGQSVASRYSQKGVTVWGKYSTANTNKKQQVSKAFSAHGNAVANQGGWSPSSGYDKDIPNNRANVKNVECFDCHNSHGSSVSGATSSYRTFDGTLNGGILKETFAGKGGYQMNYKPSVNTYAKSNNPFNAGAGLCFDCHETARAGTTPWGYSSTFGAKQPIMGYKDSPGFGTGSKGSSSRFKNRQSREEIVSSHLKAGKALANPAQGQINGLCTPCHDPHGVSRTLNEKMAYAVPLLKGAWLTSPYREDGPPSSASGKDDIQKQSGSGQASGKEHSDYNAVNRGAGANFGKGSSDAARPADYNAVNRDAGANFGKGASGAARSDYNAVNRDAGANFGKGASDAARPADYNAVNRDAGANFGKGASGAARSDYNAVNRDAGANFGKGSSDAARPADYNAVNRDAGANFGKGASGAARSDYNAVNRDAGANFGKGASDAARPADYNAVNRDAGANFGKGASGAARSDYNAVNRDAGANFGKGSSDAARPADYNAVNRDAGANFGKGASGAARSDYNAVNRDAGANFGKGASDAARPADYNAVNRDAGANFGKGASGAARSDYNAVNRDAGANFGKGSSDAARPADYNAVNRDAGANFGKGASGAARSDYNAVNRDAGANFGKGSSDAARPADYNAVNRDAGANFGKGASGAARSDYNAVNRDAGANFGKGSSDAARPADYNAVNRDAGANFGKGVSSAPQQSDYNGTNRDASVNYGKGTSSAARGDSNTSNRDSGSNFAKGGSGAPREPMKGMKYNVDQNTFDGNNRIRENDDTFGGICLKCHAKENLVGESKSGQIHRTVKGWGDNKEHSFPCSKCHQSHNSGLPRLMQTNCFEQGPSGLRESSGVPWLPYKNVNGKPNAQNVQKSDAQGGSSSKSKVVGCHVKQFGKATATSSKNQENNQWKEVTSW
jgi:hypothetical protein